MHAEQIYMALDGYETARTSPENVEDVLRAIGRLSASKPAAPQRSLEEVRADSAEHDRFRYWQDWFVNHNGHPMEAVDAWQVRAMLAASPAAPSANTQDECGGMVSVSRGALQAVINMLRRDAEEGRVVRGELADELSSAASTSANVAPAATVQAVRDACQIDNFTGRVCRYGTRSCVAEHVATVQAGEVGALDIHERNALNEAVKLLPSISALKTLRDKLLAAPQPSQPVEDGEAS